MKMSVNIERTGAFIYDVVGAAKRKPWSCAESMGAVTIRLRLDEKSHNHYWYAMLDSGAVLESRSLNTVIKAVTRELEANMI